MNTDISVSSGATRLIIDAKYYRNALSSRWETDKLHSHNLYQLMSYLTNADVQPGDKLAGMLIYPQVGRSLKEKYVIQGYPVHIATLDLSQDWQVIHSELVGLTQWGLAGVGATA